MKQKRKHVKKVESDHNLINVKLNLQWKNIKHDVVEVFNFKDVESQKNFLKSTNETEALSNIFNSQKSVAIQTKKFLKRLDGFIQENFKKVRIEARVDHKLEELYNKRRLLRNKSDEESVEKLEKVELELVDKYSEKMVKDISNELKSVKGEEGGYNPGHLWKLKKKLSPRHTDPPTAMKDSQGNLLTTEEKILAEAKKHYENVFKDKPFKEEHKNHEIEREHLCAQRLEQAFNNKTPQWTVDDVKSAIKSLNKGISKDPYGHPNELFKEGVAGKDLIEAITRLMNKLKDNPKEYPPAMQICNVTTIYKNKGDRNTFDSHRGIFRTTSLRNIMDKLIYNDECETVDENLTDCNVGSRKRRNIRDNLFVINAIMNSSKRGSDEPCDICVYDVRKCFDSLWLSECVNDLYESGLQNDKLCLLYYSN